MAPGPLYSDLENTNQALVTIGVIAALTTAKNNATFAMSPVMQAVLGRDPGFAPIIGALGIQTSIMNLGQAALAATAEGVDPTATDFAVAPATLTPARQALQRVMSDFGAAKIDGLLRGDIGPQLLNALIADGVSGWSNRLAALTKALASSVTGTAGTSGAPLAWSSFSDSVYELMEQGNSGLVCFVDLKGAKDLRDDATSLGGAIANDAQMLQFSNLSQPGYIGRFMGVCDVYMLPSLYATGGDTYGLMFGEAGIHTKHEAVPLGVGADVIADVGFLTIEAKRGAGSTTKIDTVAHMAVGIREQNGIRRLRYLT